uniref:Gamma-tubulin complex component 4 homolog n=1 Tax=Tanacetum cinerariifolium TaxID=118510 RepID=A0A6L2MCL1_TANCI|nr:gamma-tubulin complex component 4 homolog [Tanacetum cinerariifolium]
MHADKNIELIYGQREADPSDHFVVVRADLNEHLKAIRDYFLLAKGYFFQSFLEESRQLMRLPLRQLVRNKREKDKIGTKPDQTKKKTGSVAKPERVKSSLSQ